MKTAFLFPGQGSQYVGMGKALVEEFPTARSVFDEAEALLGYSLRQLCFEGPEETLQQTEHTQVAIFTVSVAAWQVLIESGARPDGVAGHSVGEYSALVAAGVLRFGKALGILKHRATFMAKAAASSPGGMVAVLGLDGDQVESLCQRVASDGSVQIANLNCPGQVVVSGEKSALHALRELALKMGARRVVPLRVSGAFHSRFMEPAARRLREVLDTLKFEPPQIPIIANVTGDYVTDPSQWPDLLAQQVMRAVQWEKTLRRMGDDGVRRFVEVGPGRVLTGLVRRTLPDVEILHVESPQEVKSYLEKIHEA